MQETANALFADESNDVTLKDGQVVHVRQGKAKHLPLLVRLFKTLLDNMSQAEMVTLVTIFSQRQKALLNKGLDPVKAPAGNLADTTEEMRAIIENHFGNDAVQVAVHDAFANTSLAMTLFAAVAEVLPDMVEALSEGLTKEQYGELDIDDAIKVVGSIIMVNYGFFSKSLPPLIRSFAGTLMTKAKASSSLSR